MLSKTIPKHSRKCYENRYCSLNSTTLEHISIYRKLTDL